MATDSSSRTTVVSCRGSFASRGTCLELERDEEVAADPDSPDTGANNRGEEEPLGLLVVSLDVSVAAVDEEREEEQDQHVDLRGLNEEGERPGRG